MHSTVWMLSLLVSVWLSCSSCNSPSLSVSCSGTVEGFPDLWFAPFSTSYGCTGLVSSNNLLVKKAPGHSLWLINSKNGISLCCPSVCSVCGGNGRLTTTYSWSWGLWGHRACSKEKDYQSSKHHLSFEMRLLPPRSLLGDHLPRAVLIVAFLFLFLPKTRSHMAQPRLTFSIQRRITLKNDE